jgi:hypothetical protein
MRGLGSQAARRAAPRRGRAPTLYLPALLAILGAATPPASDAQQIEQGVAIVAEKIASRVDGFSYRANTTSELDLRGTTLAPRLSGSVRVHTGSGKTEIAAKIDHLPDPTALGPFAVYVLWVITPEGRASNVGTLEMDREHGRIETTTPLSSFALILTAEPHFAVSVPCQHVVAQTVGANVKGTALAVTSLVARTDYTGLKHAVRDAKHPVPLELEMARYALAIAEFVAAPELATSAYDRAKQALTAAETSFAAQRSPDRAAVAEASREAIQAAEDARAAAAIRRGSAELTSLKAQLAAREQAVKDALATGETARAATAAAEERARALENRLPTPASRLQLASELLARWLPTEQIEGVLVAHVVPDDFVKGKPDLDAPMMERLAIGAGVLLGVGGFTVTVSPSLQLSEDFKLLGLAQQRARGLMDWLASLGVKAAVGPPPASSTVADAALSTGAGVDLTITAADPTAGASTAPGSAIVK